MKNFTLAEAVDTAKELGVDFDKVDFTPEDFLEGLNIELEHGNVDAQTNVTGDSPILTGKIALAHLKEFSIYYNDDIGLEAWEHVVKNYKGDTKGKKLKLI